MGSNLPRNVGKTFHEMHFESRKCIKMRLRPPGPRYEMGTKPYLSIGGATPRRIRSNDLTEQLLLWLPPWLTSYVAAKATYIRLLYGKIGILEGFFGPSSVHRGRTHIVLG